MVITSLDVPVGVHGLVYNIKAVNKPNNVKLNQCAEVSIDSDHIGHVAIRINFSSGTKSILNVETPF